MIRHFKFQIPITDEKCTNIINELSGCMSTYSCTEDNVSTAYETFVGETVGDLEDAYVDQMAEIESTSNGQMQTAHLHHLHRSFIVLNEWFESVEFRRLFGKLLEQNSKNRTPLGTALIEKMQTFCMRHRLYESTTTIRYRAEVSNYLKKLLPANSV